MQSLTIDIVSFDSTHDEYALYLVEADELPDEVNERRARLKAIQDRVFNSFDAAVDGHLAEKYPETLGQTIRIQVDCPFGTDDDVELLVSRAADYLGNAPEYVMAARNSSYVRAVRVVTGHQLGRCQQK